MLKYRHTVAHSVVRGAMGLTLLGFAVSHPAFASTVADYRFEEGTSATAASGTNSILDSSGNALNGTPINGPVYSNNVPVNPIPRTGATNNLSLSFNGSNQRVFIPDDSKFQLQSLTLEAYINLSSPVTSGFGIGQIIFRGDDRGSLDPYYLAVVNTTLVFNINDAANNTARLSAPLPGINIWIYVAGTLDHATGEMNLYINGQLVDSMTTAITPLLTLDPTTTPGLGIGSVQSESFPEYFPGLIDEVRISDTALAPNQLLNTPEPLSLSLLGFGAATLLTRRRRLPVASASA